MRGVMRPVLLNGFMATGKSRVARLVAESLGAEALDLDALVEARLGTTIAEFFRERGEAEFRRIEAKALEEVLEAASTKRLVVALGGGALLDRERRVRILGRALVVTLSAEPDVVLARARAEEGGLSKRPLLAGADPEVRLRALLAARADGYSEAHAVVATSHRTPEEVAAEVVRAVERGGVCLAAGTESYVVEIGGGGEGGRFTTERLPRLLGAPSGLLLVSDRNVEPLHGRPVRAAVAARFGATAPPFACAILEPGEEHKNLTGLESIYEAAFSASLDRKATFLGLGGGVVTDMTGFAAATWVRGVRWLGLPTTLLSMVDASVGGKTAVDYRSAKNSVGAFWQPAGVICDVATLATESDRAFVSALSEVVKTALIGDPGLFELLEERAERVLARDPEVLTEIVERSIGVKARVVALDERETGIRATLNLGHTYGHALESSGGYSTLTHGEAVSLGLVAALRFGQLRGETPTALVERTVALQRRLGLPTRLDAADLRRSVALLGLDKKRAGASLRFVFARGLGDVVAETVPLELVESSAERLADA